MTFEHALSLRLGEKTKTEDRDFSSLCPKFVLMLTRKVYFVNLGTARFTEVQCPLIFVSTYSPREPRPVQLQYTCPVERFRE